MTTPIPSRATLACLIGAFLAPTALCAQEFKLQALTLMDGNCRLQAQGGAIPCKGTVMWTEFKNGRTMLSFFKNNNSYTVSGETTAQPSEGEYRQPIDTIRYFDGDKLLDADENAKGACLFNFKANTIKCEVDSHHKKAHYAFELDKVHNIERKDF
jgi:hypothetical protein